MAGAVATRVPAAMVDRTGSFFKISFSFLRNLSTSASSSANPSDSGTGATSSKPRRRKKKKKKKNLFEVAQFLPSWGVGYHMAKTHWTNVSYEITKINLYKVCIYLSIATSIEGFMGLLGYGFLCFCRMVGMEKLGALLMWMVFLFNYS